MELSPQSGASVAVKSGGLFKKTKVRVKKGASEASTTRKLNVMLNYVLDLSDYAGISTVLSNVYMV